MLHFVQYHNWDAFGPYRPPTTRFGVFTDKSVESTLNNRIWLVVGKGRPREYFLGETFVVERVSRRRDRPRNRATASHGVPFRPLVRIDNEPWFPSLQRATGNFAFGLQKVQKRQIIVGLLAAASGRNARPAPKTSRQWNGAGFGSIEENRRVERAAIRAVSALYRERGWRVTSREALHLGYDLLCTERNSTHHVEVKGIRGSLCSFPITANETQAAEADPNFRLCVVLKRP